LWLPECRSGLAGSAPSGNPADATSRQITVAGYRAMAATMVWQNENGAVQPGAVLVVERA
jgi:hypothetical protein